MGPIVADAGFEGATSARVTRLPSGAEDRETVASQAATYELGTAESHHRTLPSYDINLH